MLYWAFQSIFLAKLARLKIFYIYIYYLVGHEILNIKRFLPFIILMYISCGVGKNVRKMAKYEILNFKCMRQAIYHLLGHENMNKVVSFACYFYFRF